MGFSVGGENIAIGVVLEFHAVRIEPVIEQLAAEDMAPNTPHMAVAVHAQHVVALAERIEVKHFVCAVLVFLLDAAGEHQGVMVRGRAAEVQAEEAEIG